MAVALMSLTGCYQWVAVKPSKLPKTAAEVVEIDTKEDEMTFWRPRATIEVGDLIISGDNLPPTAIPLDQITEARVGRRTLLDTVTSTIIILAGIGIGVVIVKVFPLQFPGP
jgi:hypothetical protein